MKFKAITTFDCKENNSVYCAGQIYTIREGNEKLRKLVKQWVLESKVCLIKDSQTSNMAQTTGTGIVENTITRNDPSLWNKITKKIK